MQPVQDVQKLIYLLLTCVSLAIIKMKHNSQLILQLHFS